MTGIEPSSSAHWTVALSVDALLSKSDVNDHEDDYEEDEEEEEDDYDDDEESDEEDEEESDESEEEYYRPKKRQRGNVYEKKIAPPKASKEIQLPSKVPTSISSFPQIQVPSSSFLTDLSLPLTTTSSSTSTKRKGFFSGMSFYFVPASPFTSSVAILRKHVRDNGGENVYSMETATYVVATSSQSLHGINGKIVSEKFILDSVSNGTQMRENNYLIR